MPLRRVKLVDGAFEKAQDLDTNLGFFETRERFDAEVGEDGYVLVRPREWDRLKLYDLVEDAEIEPMSQGRNAEDEDDPGIRERTQRTRDHDGVTTAVHPGGVGHQPGDNYDNRRVHAEIVADQQRGAALRQERGLPPLADTIFDEDRRSDHSLPEQVKEFEQAEQDRDKDLERTRKEAAKEREKAEKARQKAAEREEKRQEKRAKEEQKGTADPDAAAQQARESEQAEGERQAREAKEDESAKGESRAKGSSVPSKDSKPGQNASQDQNQAAGQANEKSASRRPAGAVRDEG